VLPVQKCKPKFIELNFMAVPDIALAGPPPIDPPSKRELAGVKSIREYALEKQTQKRSFSRRAEKYQDKRDAILKQSARLFSDQGFANVSLDDVAEKIGIAKPAIYYYFSSKEQILFECFIEAFDVADRIMKEILVLTLPGREKLELYMRSYLLSHLNGQAPSMPSHDLNALSKSFRTRIERRRRVRRNRLRELVSLAIAEGTFEPCDPAIFMSAWGGAVSWVIESYDDRGGLSAEQVTDQMVYLFLNGALAKKKS
jgi:AcrR family transcriptional regulator